MESIAKELEYSTSQSGDIKEMLSRFENAEEELFRQRTLDLDTLSDDVLRVTANLERELDQMLTAQQSHRLSELHRWGELHRFGLREFFCMHLQKDEGAKVTGNDISDSTNHILTQLSEDFETLQSRYTEKGLSVLDDTQRQRVNDIGAKGLKPVGQPIEAVIAAEIASTHSDDLIELLLHTCIFEVGLDGGITCLADDRYSGEALSQLIVLLEHSLGLTVQQQLSLPKEFEDVRRSLNSGASMNSLVKRFETGNLSYEEYKEEVAELSLRVTKKKWSKFREILLPHQSEVLDKLIRDQAVERFGVLGWMATRNGSNSLQLNDSQRRHIQNTHKDFLAEAIALSKESEERVLRATLDLLPRRSATRVIEMLGNRPADLPGAPNLLIARREMRRQE